MTSSDWVDGVILHMLAGKLNALEKKYDAQFREVFEAIRQLMIPPEPKRRPIGFRTGDK